MIAATNRGVGHAGWSRTALALAAAAGLACAAMSGCDSESASTRTIEEASQLLASLNPDGQNPVGEAFKTEKYNKIIALLKGVSGGTDGEAAAASILMSQAQTGLAERPAAEAALHEQDAINQVTLIRSALSERQERVAVAAAAASYNPAPDLAAIDKESAEKDTQVKAEQQRKAAIEKEAGELLAQSKAKAAEAQAERREEAVRRQQAATVSATMAEQILREAMLYRRRADALEAEAALLEARSAKVAPGAVEVQSAIERLGKQKELLAVARREALKRQEVAKKRAAEADADAAKIAADIGTMAKALGDLASGELKSSNEKAIAAYAQALATAKGAVKTNKASANLVVGATNQAIGDLRWTHAEGARQRGVLMSDLGSASPALASAADYTTRAAEASADTEASLKAAVEAYTAARAAYEASGGGDQARAAIERLNGRLAEALYATSAGAVDLRQETTEPAESPTEGGAEGKTAGAPGGTAGSAIQQLIDASKAKNWSAMKALFYTSDPGLQGLIDAQFTMAPSAAALDAACKEKFGTTLTEAAGALGGSKGTAQPGSIQPSQFENLSLSDFSITESGDTARASHGGTSLPLRKVSGQWRIDVGMMLADAGVTPALAAAATPMIGPMAKVFDELTAEVKAGKHANMPAVLAALQQKMMGAMVPPPNGGG